MSESRDEDSGGFAVSHDLRFTAIQAGPNSPLFSDADMLRGQSIWAAFHGEMRPAARAAFKRLLGGENSVVWEARDEGRGLRYTIETHRVADGFLNRFRITGRHPHRVPTPESEIPLPVREPAPQSPLTVPLEEREQSISPASATDTTLFASLAIASVLPARAPEEVTPASVLARVPEETDLFFRISADPLCILDAAGRFEQVNPAWTRAFEQDTAALRGTPLLEKVHPDEQETVRRHLQMAVTGQEPVSVACRYERPDGAVRWLNLTLAVATSGLRVRLYGTARDITESRAAEETMRWQANHDALTGLPNRALLHDRLEYTLPAASRRHHHVGILFIDLDRFKRINDTLGHAAGDVVLREVAERLRGALREEDTISRYGGDEFVVLLPNIRGVEDARRVAEKLMNRFEQLFNIGAHNVPVSCSVGISIFPEDGHNADTLIHAADQAMYRAKKSGPGHVALRVPGVEAINPIERLTLESRLSQALDREELRLHYQPQVCVSTGRVVGVEALMRWQNELGSVSPSTFIPVAEESGLINRIGSWAVHEACRQAVDWKRAGYPLQMGVNLSAVQLLDTRFPDKLHQYLREVGLPTRQIDLELTESAIMRNEDSARETLLRLHDLGFRLSVDDFGTKYSSLMYLRNLPIDGVKVDREFVSEIAKNPRDADLVKAIIDLSHTLGLKVIAEGVETPEQRDCLLNLGCDIMQGHLFSAAVSPREVTSLLQSGVPGNPRLERRFDKRF